MAMQHIDKLASEIRDINTANGWNIFLEREAEYNVYKVPAIICLIQSEVTEAVDEMESGDSEAFMYELADVAIRILDFVGGYKNVNFGSVVNSTTPPIYEAVHLFEDVMLNLHKRCTLILEAYRKKGRDEVLQAAADLYVAVFEASARVIAEARTEHVDLYAYITNKMEQNRQRGYRHGGRKV